MTTRNSCSNDGSGNNSSSSIQDDSESIRASTILRARCNARNRNCVGSGLEAPAAEEPPADAAPAAEAARSPVG